MSERSEAKKSVKSIVFGNMHELFGKKGKNTSIFLTNQR